MKKSHLNSKNDVGNHPNSNYSIFHQKPQISSIPGVPVTETNRYRVVLGDLVLGDRLTSNEALEIAKLGGAKA